MKKLSELIQENENQKQYKYTAKVDIQGYVIALDEGVAGELVDQAIDELSQHVNVENYEIISIDEAENTNNFSENIVNEYGDDYADNVFHEIMDMITDKIENNPNLTDYYKAMIYTKLRNNI